jgi:HlyD family secretion protein
VLEIPVKAGDQVIESNSFNSGTTIAAIADLSKMIFEGKVDEAEVASLRLGTTLKVSLGAVEDQELDAILKFIAPKGTEEQGAVQFKIEADMLLDDSIAVRAGYSANASIVLERKADVLALREALIQFDRMTQEPYVQIMTGDQKFERKDVKLGISDGENVEVLQGVDEEDAVKVWNRTEDLKDDNKNANTDEDDA